MRIGLALIAFVLLVSAAARAADAPPEALQKDLEAILDKYQSACASGDIWQFRQLVSSRMYAQVQNRLASSGLDLTGEQLKDNLRMQPDPARLTFWTFLHQGPTAGLVFTDGPLAHDAAAPPQIQVFLCRFVQEQGTWRVDRGVGTVIAKSGPNGAPARVEDVTWPPGAAVNGVVEPAESLFPKADYVGNLDVVAVGCQVDITINGIKQAPIDQTASTRVVWGGLNEGDNSITVAVTPRKAPAGSRRLQVIVRTVNPDRSIHRVFELEPSGEPQPQYSDHFIVGPVPTTRPAAKDEP